MWQSYIASPSGSGVSCGRPAADGSQFESRVTQRDAAASVSARISQLFTGYESELLDITGLPWIAKIYKIYTKSGCNFACHKFRPIPLTVFVDFPACSCKSQAVCVHVQKVAAMMCSVCLRLWVTLFACCACCCGYGRNFAVYIYIYKPFVAYFNFLTSKILVLASWNLCHLHRFASSLALHCRQLLKLSWPCNRWTWVRPGIYAIRDRTVELIIHTALERIANMRTYMKTHFDFYERLKHRYLET